MRLTATAPEALRDACNQLAMVLAFGPPDAKTYGSLRWQDSEGNLYAAASFIALDHWIAAATQPLERPEWDTEEIIDMEAAERAQAAMVVYLGSGDGEEPISVPQASPDALTVVAGDDGLSAIASMGLTPVPENEEV
jgi:hypothetical protein